MNMGIKWTNRYAVECRVRGSYHPGGMQSEERHFFPESRGGQRYFAEGYNQPGVLCSDPFPLTFTTVQHPRHRYMDDTCVAPPRLERMAWERRMVRGLAGHTFSETLLITETSASDGADLDDKREGRQPQSRPPPHLLRRDASRAYLLLRLLSHDKLHVATMLASEVREDKATGVMIQEAGPYYVVKVSQGERKGGRGRGAGDRGCKYVQPGCGQHHGRSLDRGGGKA